MTEAETGVICFVHRKGPQTKEYRQLEDRKGKKIYSPFKISKLCQHFDFSPTKLILDSRTRILEL